MTEKPSISVVMPIFNEGQSLAQFLPNIVQTCAQQGWCLIIVNDGSTDESGRILAGYKANSAVKIIQHKINRGYGGALKSGIASASTQFVATMDGDGQHEITDVARIFQYALETDADLVVGQRIGAFKDDWFRMLGKSLIRSFARVLVTCPIHDLNSGFKLYRTDLAKKYLKICPDSMAFSDVITLVFISQHNLVLELPITVYQRMTGRSTIRFQTALDTFAEILSIALMFNPLRVFIPLSIFCIVAGLAWGLPIIFAGRGVSVASMLAILSGGLVFLIGLVASQLSALRMQLLAEDQDETNKTKAG